MSITKNIPLKWYSSVKRIFDFESQKLALLDHLTLGAFHKVNYVVSKSANFDSSPPLLDVFSLSKIGNFWPPHTWRRHSLWTAPRHKLLSIYLHWRKFFKLTSSLLINQHLPHIFCFISFWLVVLQPSIICFIVN